MYVSQGWGLPGQKSRFWQGQVPCETSAWRIDSSLPLFCPAFPDGRSTFADPSSTSTAPVLQSSLSGLPIFSHRPHSTTVFKILLTRMSYWTRAQQASFYLCENLSSKPQAEDLGPGLEGVSGKRLTDTSVTCQGPINCQRFVGIPTHMVSQIKWPSPEWLILLPTRFPEISSYSSSRAPKLKTQIWVTPNQRAAVKYLRFTDEYSGPQKLHHVTCLLNIALV